MYSPIEVQRTRLSRINLRGMLNAWIPWVDDSTSTVAPSARDQHGMRLDQFFILKSSQGFAYRVKGDRARVLAAVEDLLDGPLTFSRFYQTRAHLNIAKANLLVWIDEVLYGIQP